MHKERKDIGTRVAGDKAQLADEFITLSQLEALDGIEIGQRDNNGITYFPSGIISIKPDVRYKKNLVLRINLDMIKFKQHFIDLTEWVINHNLNTYPTVELISDTGVRMYAYHENVNYNQTIVKFNIPTSGWAYCF